jgi:hypothetical protein
MNLYYLEIIIALVSVLSSFYLVLQYLLRFQRRIDRILIVLSISSEKLEDIEAYLEKELGYHIRRQVNEDFLPQLDSDIL